jgi:conjugal transfer mating pair stabilization protein TraN
MSNGNLAGKLSLAISGFQIGAGYAAAVGSEYTYDFVMNNVPGFMENGWVGLSSAMQGNSWMTAGVGMYGFGTTAASAAGTAASALGASTSSVAIGSVGSTTIYFNPYGLAAAVAIKLVMDVMSCTQSEKDLANAKSQNLCRYIGDYCSNELKVLGVSLGCLETTQTYCCYNGLLGKAIEEGAHSQLTISWGSSQSPNCAGLTMDQLKLLDFTTPAMKAALKPFMDQIMANFKAKMAPDLASGTVKANATQRVMANSAALCLQRKQFDASTVCN